MKFKHNMEESIKHFEYFWNLDYLERCCLSIIVKDEKFVARKTSLSERFANMNFLDETARGYYGDTTYFAEALPAKYVNFGTAAHCEFFGCTPNYEPSTIWFNEILHEPDINLIKNFDIKTNKAYLKQINDVKKLVELANNDYLVSMTDNCGIVDCLAIMRGTENLLIDMLEEPDFVHEAMNKITVAWQETQKEFAKVIKENNYGGCSHGWMQLWCPDSHTQIQCDYSAMISPALFEEFLLEELEKTSNTLAFTTYHLDGVEQLRHLDMILSVKGINNIQWTPVAGQPKTSCNIEALQKIQKSGKGLVLIPELDEVEFLMNNLSHKGLHLLVNRVENEETAKSIIKLAEKTAH